MARITVEDCLTKETNRFALVLLAAKRTKQLLHGATPLIDDRRENKSVVTALREIADGQVRFKSEEDLKKELEEARREREARLQEAEAPDSSGDSNSSNGEGSQDDSSDTGEVSPSAVS